MRVQICLLLILATQALGRSKYKRSIGGDASFNDRASVSVSPDGVNGEFNKNLNIKPKFDLFGIFGHDDKSSKSKEMGLSINGGVGFHPKLSFDKDGGGIGVSLGGKLGFGISNNSHEKKKDSDGHNEFKEHHEWWEESNGHKISGSAGNNKGGKKHNDRHSESHEEHSSWDEERVIFVPLYNEDKSNGVKWTSNEWNHIDNKGHSIKGGKTSKGEKDKTSMESVIILPFGESDGASESSERDSRGESHKQHYSHDVRKKGTGSHVGGGGKVIISHGNGESSKNNDKEHNSKQYNKHGGQKEGAGSTHIGKGGGHVIISHGGGKQSNGNDKEHNGKQDKNYGIKKGSTGNVHVGGGIDIISHGKPNNEHGRNDKGSEKNHIKHGGGIVISKGEHQNNDNKWKGHQETSTRNYGKKEEIKGGVNSHTGGKWNITLSHNHGGKTSDGGIKHNSGGDSKGSGNVNHGSSIKGVNVTVGNHGGSHDKHDQSANNCNGIFGNEKCGTNVKKTLKIVQTFISTCDAIMAFLLEMKEVDLRNMLCHISPRNSKLSCQLGCNIPRLKPIYKLA